MLFSINDVLTDRDLLDELLCNHAMAGDKHFVTSRMKMLDGCCRNPRSIDFTFCDFENSERKLLKSDEQDFTFSDFEHAGRMLSKFEEHRLWFLCF